MANVTVYTKDHCAYCTWAKLLLETKHIPFDEVRVDLDPAKLKEMLTRSQKRTTPQIFIGDLSIGGYDELSALAKSGELDKLLSNTK